MSVVEAKLATGRVGVLCVCRFPSRLARTIVIYIVVCHGQRTVQNRRFFAQPWKSHAKILLSRDTKLKSHHTHHTVRKYSKLNRNIVRTVWLIATVVHPYYCYNSSDTVEVRWWLLQPHIKSYLEVFHIWCEFWHHCGSYCNNSAVCHVWLVWVSRRSICLCVEVGWVTFYQRKPTTKYNEERVHEPYIGLDVLPGTLKHLRSELILEK